MAHLPLTSALAGSSPVTVFLVIPLAAYCLWSLIQHFSSPLRKYPGPFFARKNPPRDFAPLLLSSLFSYPVFFPLLAWPSPRPVSMIDS